MKRCSASLIIAAAAKSLQSFLTLCDPIDSSPPGSPIPGILQARTLEWVGISFSNAWKRKMKVKSLSRVQLLATPWTVAYQAPLPMGFSRQEYWSGVPLPSPRNANQNCNDLSPHTGQNGHHQKVCTINAREGLENRERSCTVGGNVNWLNHYGRQYGDSL